MPSVLLLDLYCNSEPTAQIVYVLREEDNSMWVEDKVFKHCQLPQRVLEPKQYHNRDYYPLSEVQWLTALYDAQALTLNIIVPSHLLPPQKAVIEEVIPNAGLRPTLPGVYLNYDASFQYNHSHTWQNAHHFATTLEGVYFNHWGVGASTFLVQNGEETPEVVRLCSTWTLDKPEEIATWRIGDSFTGGTLWSGIVQFGGIQYARNFGTQPRLITIPLPAMKGQAVVPTTVNFYLNNHLERTQEVGVGAFEIAGIPINTGANSIVVETQDVLGRQTIAAFPFYMSQSFLQPGLTRFSYEIGAIRNNYAIQSNNYSDVMLVGTFEKGLRDNLTAGWHSEILAQHQTLGVNSSVIVARFIEWDAAVACSHSDKGVGGLLLLGAQRKAPRYSFGAQITLNTENWQQLGIQEWTLAPKGFLQSYASYNTSTMGTWSINYAQQWGRTDPNFSLMSLNYTATWYKRIYFITGIVHQGGEYENNSILFSWVWSPKPDYTLSTGFENNNNQNRWIFSASKNLPTDNGYGYSVVGSAGEHPYVEADFALQTDTGLYGALFARRENDQYVELDASGSMVYFANVILPARKIDNSFVLVEVPQLSNIPIYKSNQPIEKTNKKGYALISRVLPYDENMLSLDPNDLPLNTLLQTDKAIVTPYYKSGSYLRFPVVQVVHLSFTLVNTQQKPLAPGSEIILDVKDKKYGIERFSIGYDGKVFISTQKLFDTLSGVVQLENGSCRFEKAMPKTDQPVIQLGTLTCMPVHS